MARSTYIYVLQTKSWDGLAPQPHGAFTVKREAQEYAIREKLIGRRGLQLVVFRDGGGEPIRTEDWSIGD